MSLLRKIFGKFAEWSQSKHKFVYADELPERVKDKTFYIIGDSKHPWLLAFYCPCGCKNIIQLNLLKEAKPHWKFNVSKKNKIDISPSVWRTTGCKSHFFVYKSKINWVRNYKSYEDSKPRDFFSFWK